MRRLSALTVAVGLGIASPAPAKPAQTVRAPAPVAKAPDAAATVVKLVGSALTDGFAYRTAGALSDGVGPRPAGSDGAARAVAWATRAMREAGLSNVHTEAVTVPRWVRGEERGELVAPTVRALHLTALGGSVATPPEGLTGELVEVGSLEELAQLAARDPAAVRGKIVLFYKVQPRSARFDGYGSVVGLRSRGAIAAAKVGAVAALVRSAGTGAFRLPHTGAMRYEEGVAKIPAAALAAEDADLLHRLAGSKRTVKLVLGTRELAPVASANVVGEVRGREKPDEVVLFGAHLDSWDLGDGALDDASGCAIALEVARLLAATPPRRTLRVVLFMNEEFGLSGAKAYVEQHKDELGKHVAAFEADSGAGRPLAIAVSGGDAATKLLGTLAAPLAGFVPALVHGTDEVGADLIPLQQAIGVPVVGVDQDVSHYFDWHHTAGDTFDKIDAGELALATAAYAALTWLVADTLDRLPPTAVAAGAKKP